MKQQLAFVLVVCLATACATGPEFPDEVTFEGKRLEKATDWSMGRISGVVFVPPGETLEAASLQLGLLVSGEHGSAGELHQWVMEQYRKSPTSRWHEASGGNEACKVGLTPGPRPFVALHICRSAGGLTACAEADQRIGDDIVGRCLNRGYNCWDEVCYQMWTTKRSALEAQLDAVLESQ